MMAKRKATNQPGQSKRARVAREPSSSQHLHGEVDEDVEYKIKSIIGESKTKYHIEWEDDEATGKSWPPTWEPKANANQLAIDDWEQQKADQRKKEKQQSTKRTPSRSTSAAGTPRPAARKAAARGRRIIDSSPPQPESTRTNGHVDNTSADADDEVLEIGESPETSPLVRPNDPDSLFVPELPLLANGPSPAVNLSAPPSSYFAGAYHKYSSQIQSNNSSVVDNDDSAIEPSQYVPDPADTSKTTDDTTEISLAPTTPSQQVRSVPVQSNTGSTKIVPDTQAAPGSSSYIPSTTTKSSSAPEASRATAQSQGQTQPSNPESGEESPRPQNSADDPDQIGSVEADRPAPSEANPPQGETDQPVPSRRSESEGVDVTAGIEGLQETSETLSAEPSGTGVHRPSKQGIEPGGKNGEEESAQASGLHPSAGQQESQSTEHTQESVTVDSEHPGQPADTESSQRQEKLDTSAQPVEDLGSEPTSGSPPSGAQLQGPNPEAEEPGGALVDNEHPTSAQPQAITQADGGAEQPIQATSRSQSVESSSGALPKRSGTPRVTVIDGRAKIYTPRFEVQTIDGRAELVHTSTEIESQIPPPIDQSEPHPGSFGSSGQGITKKSQPSVDSNQISQSARGGSAARPATNQIDLTTAATQDRTDSISNFAVTPPPRRQLSEYLSRRSPPPPSTGLSSVFPFDTQPPKQFSTGIAPLSVVQRRPEVHSQPAAINHTQLSHLSTILSSASSVPFGQSSPLRNSSPIAKPPSQTLGVGTFGESAPRRPATPSSPIRSSSAARSSMEPSKERHSSLKEWRQSLRRKRQEELDRASEAPTSAGSALNNSQPPSSVPPHVSSETHPAVGPRLASPLLAQDGRRSPSAVPALEPRRTSTLEEMNTSARYETLLPQSQEQNDDARERNGSLAAAGTPAGQPSSDDPETKHVHAVPISLVGHQRDEYPQLIYCYRDTIQRFLATASPDNELVSEAEKLVDRARRIAMHPDLDNAETLTQYADVAPSRQADWDVRCSAKFRFLKKLLDCLRNQWLHIAIVAQSGRIMHLLETFLQGIRIAYRRADASTLAASEEMPDGNVMITLFALGEEQTAVHAPVVDLVVAMDNAATHHSSQIKMLRHRDEKWSPMITLVVPRTVEHVERCLSSTISYRARLRALVSGINQFKSEAGKAEVGQLQPEDTASTIANFLTSAGGDPEWPLAALSPLDDLGSQTESEIDAIIEDGSTPTHAGNKRPREAEDEDMGNGESHKRLREEAPLASAVEQLPSTINPQDVERTHISDSVDHPTQSNVAESDAVSLTANERRLQELLIAAQNQLEEHKRDLAERQYAFEEKRTELNEIKLERDSAILTATKAVERFNEQTNRISTLKAEKTILADQLAEANVRLLNHSVPEQAEFEKVRLAALELNTEKEKADKRLAEANKQLEYTRRLYQDASNSAQQSAIEISELTNQLSSSQNKATGEQAKLRQMGYDAFAKNLQDENKKLKAVVKNHEAALKLRDDEIAKLKEASRGRMGTRGNSVPRSPRMGSPMKLDRRVGSRQGSPAAGELRGMLHPLRNA